MKNDEKINVIFEPPLELPGGNRKSYDVSVRLGKKLDIFKVNPALKRHMAFRGMANANLIASWDNIIGKIYADHSVPEAIKNISGIKTLLIKVRYTRIIEFQHQKAEFIKQVNAFVGFALIGDIRFIRTETLPPKRQTTTISQMIIPNEPHPKLVQSSSVQIFQEQDLEKALNVLAYLVMPLGFDCSEKKIDILYKDKPASLLESWRDRAKVILNCHH